MAPPPSLQDMIETVPQDSPTGRALDQLVTAATAVAQLEDTSDAMLGHFVDRCRREGRSWSEISAALGVTKQAVHKRFAGAMADQIMAAVPEPSFERFTSRARNVLTVAVRSAQAGRARQLASSAHILLALYAEPEGIAAKVLQTMNVTKDAVEAAIESAPATARPADASDQAKDFTPDGRRALRDALAIALELVHNYIGTEHLLLALYRNPGSPAAAILTAAGTTEQEARTHVTELLRGFG